MTIAKVLFIYIASYLPVFTFWLPQRGIRSWVCNEDDDQCKRARIQVDSMVFFGEMLCEVVGLGKDLMFALYPLRLVGNFKDDALMAIPALMSAGVMSIFLWKSSLALKKRIPAAVAVGIVALWVCPVLILFIAPFIFLLLINYPIACAILFLPLLLVATIPSSDAFPNSNISILEMDQTAAIFVAIAFGVMSIRRQFMRVASEKDDNKEAERLPEYIDISKGEVS
ncbi:hypothetical protein DL96DRAFT_1617494 [Flagelloscypha sp. PMI_526]|nr:hypothetical protein DL96DRAFT_1617494 [Flagelloscypha sp. PMI_526]